MKTFIVKDSEIPGRADIFVASKYPEFTRSSLSALFDKELVKLNGKPARAASKLHKADKVVIDETLLKQEPPKVELPVIYENEEVIVINKPAGMLTHAKGALNTESTVASFIKPHLKDVAMTGNRAGIVHRLDRATSGVIIAAKTDKALKWLQKQFSTRKVNKTYLAVVEGVVKPPEAIIDAPMQRNPKKPQTFKVGAGGKEAQTKYNALETFKKGSKIYTLMELNPKTGRTHQLRVHLKYIGHPIVGDPVYGNDDGNLMLHAKSLELSLPGGERKILEIEPPKAFNDFINS